MFTSENRKSAYAGAAVIEDAEGRWLSLREALAYAKVSKPTLYGWTRRTPFLPGQKLRTKRGDDANGKNRYYLQSQLDQIIRARMAAWPDPTRWVLVEEACRRFGWSERNLYRWLKEGCPDIAGDFPGRERRTVPITMADGREQSVEKLFLHLPDLERIAAAQGRRNSTARAQAGARLTTAEAMQRLGVDRQWLRRRIKGCAELGGETLDVERREVRRANSYRTRRIYDYFFLKEQIDRLAEALGTPRDVFTDGAGRRWWSRKAALAECGKRFRHLTPRILQYYPNKPCPALDYQVLSAQKQPRPAGRGGRYGTLDYFLESDLLRLKPADATKRKGKLAGGQVSPGSQTGTVPTMLEPIAPVSPPEKKPAASPAAAETLGGAINPDPANSSNPTEFELKSWLSYRDLAVRFHVKAAALRERLNRWRRPADEGKLWREVANRRPREPQYLYLVSAVWPIIEKLRGV